MVDAVSEFFLLITVCLLLLESVCGFIPTYQTQQFKVGIEYDNSLPMTGGQDRYRHVNNYDPFFVTLRPKAKDGYVLTYVEVKTTLNYFGIVSFNTVSGKPGSKEMSFLLVSNNSDFLSYSYMSYGITQEEWNKVSNIIIIPVENKADGLNPLSLLLSFSLAISFYLYNQ